MRITAGLSNLAAVLMVTRRFGEAEPLLEKATPTRLGKIVQKRPRVYQDIGGRRVAVAARVLRSV